MNARALLADPAVPVALALVAGLLLVVSERRQRPLSVSLGLLLALVPCALVLVQLDAAGWALAPLVAAVVVGALARERPDPLPGECALKLVWVLGCAFALTAVGLALLALATGVTAPLEQWSVLQLGLSPRTVWAVALPLALLAGVVLLGGAPFHFWVADLFQGAPVALTPLAVATLQGLGAMWIVRRIAGLEAFAAGAALAGTLLRTAAIAALLAGSGTLLLQRRPERRVGTLASLQGGLALAALAITAGRGPLDARFANATPEH
jgi:NADH:ubiquinone oxidoreductase subunit 2 (subunit N)